MNKTTSWIDVFKFKESKVVTEGYFPTAKSNAGGNLTPRKAPPSGGFDTKTWFWASEPPSPPTRVNQPKPPPKEAAPAEPDTDSQINQILIDNPEISAATLLNTLKAKGFIISKGQISLEADSASSNAAVLKSEATDGLKPQEKTHSDKWDRCVDDVTKKGSAVDPYAVCTSQLGSGSYEAKKGKRPEDKKLVDMKPLETKKVLKQNHRLMEFNFKIKEATINDGIGPTKFKVKLIEEGLGNFKDCFYYTKEALAQSCALFEGKKMYANHPDAIEEQTRPERSVRDIVGNYENIKMEEDDDGRACMVGDLDMLGDNSYDWARGLVRRAVLLGPKFPDKEFVGLSINANGEAEEMPIVDFLQSYKVPDSAMQKIKEAMESGAKVIRVVQKLTDVVSCDLVTEPGAGGKVLKMIENNKNAK